MKAIQNRFTHKQAGATMVEYALMVALVALAVAGTVVLLSNAINDRFNDVIDCVQDQANCPAAAE